MYIAARLHEPEIVFDGPMEAGWYQVTFDARELPSGTYFYRLTAGGKVITRSMTLVK